jgi:hypothetical protein
LRRWAVTTIEPTTRPKKAAAMRTGWVLQQALDRVGQGDDRHADAEQQRDEEGPVDRLELLDHPEKSPFTAAPSTAAPSRTVSIRCV